MSLSVFSTKNAWYKNGMFWWSKILNKAVGEHRYDAIRMYKRVNSLKWYYNRQQALYELFVDYPELAALSGIYPKTDVSHGFPNPYNYEMYRDFQENTINSDGWFGMWILYVAVIYWIHLFYNYMFPYYWIKFGVGSGEMARLRMRDSIGSTVAEEAWGNQYMEMGFTPHDFAYQRTRGLMGYSNLDDPRLMHMSTFNRKHRYKEHYLERVGDSGSMKADR